MIPYSRILNIVDRPKGSIEITSYQKVYIRARVLNVLNMTIGPIAQGPIAQ